MLHTLAVSLKRMLALGVLAISFCYTNGQNAVVRSSAEVLYKNEAAKKTAGGKIIAPVIDIFPQICGGKYNLAKVADEIKLLKDLGFERIYFVVSNPGFPSFSSPAFSRMPAGQPMSNYASESILHLGDPDLAYLTEAKKQGMEAWAIYKPYEGGSGQTIPETAIAENSGSHVRAIGGNHVYFDDLLSRRPELRVRRKAFPDSVIRRLDEPVNGFEIAFPLDPVKYNISRGKVVNFPGIPDSAIQVPRIDVWVSADNGRYSRYAGDIEVSAKVEYRIGRDANGFAIDKVPARYLVATIRFSEGSAPGKENNKYFALTIDDKEQGLVTIPYSMIKAFTASGEIPVTTAVYARKPRATPPFPGGYTYWGMESLPVKGKEALDLFQFMGFEFEWYGVGHYGTGWSDDPVFGIAVGKAEYMKGTPCEGYDEVRAYWIDHVRRLIDMGFDGIDIRLQNHSGMVADYTNYGYNEPIVERYRDKFGVDITKAEADPLKVMEIRGGYFLEFLKQASEVIHGANKKLQIHLKSVLENPTLGDGWHDLGSWLMPKISFSWQQAIDLADEVTLKDYHFNNYRPERSGKIKAYAGQQNKKVWVHAYFSQGGELNKEYFSAIENDAAVGGVLLYEANGTLINIRGELQDQHKRNIRQLRSILKSIGFK